MRGLAAPSTAGSSQLKWFDAINTHKAEDAVEVDTTELTLDEVVDRVAALVAGAR